MVLITSETYQGEYKSACVAIFAQKKPDKLLKEPPPEKIKKYHKNNPSQKLFAHQWISSHIRVIHHPMWPTVTPPLHACVKSFHLSLTSVLRLVPSAWPPAPKVRGSSTTTWGLSRKHQPLWTPTWSLRSWMTTVLNVPSVAGCFWESMRRQELLHKQTKNLDDHQWPTSLLILWLDQLLNSSGKLYNVPPHTSCYVDHLALAIMHNNTKKN